jgi:signal transduction histidine kinase
MHHTRADGTAFPVSECSIHATLHDGKVRRVKDEVFWRKDGTSFAVEYTCTPTHDDLGHANGCVVTFTDVTERKRFEADIQEARVAAETASRSKTEFLANMSHEIRTPLNGIIGMTDLLTGTTLTAEQKDFLETIHGSGENLLTIVNDVLDFSKIEFGKLELDYHAFNMLDLVDDVVGMFSFRMTKKKLEFITTMQDGLPADFLGDATRIRQILINLVANAIKFTEHGQVSLEVCAGAAEEKPEMRRVLFRIRDTGIGIPEDRIDRLFKVFSQVDASTTRRFGGSGLGLAICQKLVEIMGGTIRVESAPDRGSTFSFELPLVLGHQESPEPKIESELVGRRVLIVDDIETNRRMLTLQLARWGMTWVDVSTGDAALLLLENGEQFDAALIDFQMPNMDGIMVARQIGRTLKGHPLPLILISSQTGDVSITELNKAGFSAALAKPLRQNLLRSTLQQVFRNPTQAFLWLRRPRWRCTSLSTFWWWRTT